MKRRGTWQSQDSDAMQSQAGVHPLPLHERSDEYLLHALASGATWAMEPLYYRYGGLLYSLAYRMVGNHQIAEDLVQETFLAIWQHAISYTPQGGPVRWWLVSLIRHRTIDYLRGVRRHSCWKEIPWEEAEREEDAALPDVWEEAWGSVQRDQVREALLQLPAEQCLVIILAYFRGWTQAEIAQRCQLPFGTVKSRLRLGLLHLKHLLEDREEGGVLPLSTTRLKEAQPRQAVTVIVRLEGGCLTGYELCQNGACRCFRYTEWGPLLEQIDTFEFLGTSGKFTARKEKRLHGRSYWYAFGRGGTHRQRTYLGRPSELTLARLEDMARKLHEGK